MGSLAAFGRELEELWKTLAAHALAGKGRVEL